MMPSDNSNQPPRHRIYHRRPALDLIEFALLALGGGAGAVFLFVKLFGHP
jgi:hypothetical protein